MTFINYIFNLVIMITHRSKIILIKIREMIFLESYKWYRINRYKYIIVTGYYRPEKL